MEYIVEYPISTRKMYLQRKRDMTDTKGSGDDDGDDDVHQSLQNLHRKG